MDRPWGPPWTFSHGLAVDLDTIYMGGSKPAGPTRGGSTPGGVPVPDLFYHRWTNALRHGLLRVALAWSVPVSWLTNTQASPALRGGTIHSHQVGQCMAPACICNPRSICLRYGDIMDLVGPVSPVNQ
jgi:hypothetical protein